MSAQATFTNTKTLAGLCWKIVKHDDPRTISYGNSSQDIEFIFEKHALDRRCVVEQQRGMKPKQPRLEIIALLTCYDRICHFPSRRIGSSASPSLTSGIHLPPSSLFLFVACSAWISGSVMIHVPRRGREFHSNRRYRMPAERRSRVPCLPHPWCFFKLDGRAAPARFHGIVATGLARCFHERIGQLGGQLVPVLILLLLAKDEEHIDILHRCHLRRSTVRAGQDIAIDGEVRANKLPHLRVPLDRVLALRLAEFEALPVFFESVLRGARPGWGIFYNNAFKSRGRINFSATRRGEPSWCVRATATYYGRSRARVGSNPAASFAPRKAREVRRHLTSRAHPYRRLTECV